MTDEMKANDATRFLVVAMEHDSFKVIGIHDSEGKAQEEAKSCAEGNEGAIYGVFQKLGTARLVKKVEWSGQRG